MYTVFIIAIYVYYTYNIPHVYIYIYNLGGRGKTKARLACDVIPVFLAMISLDGAQLLQQ